MSLWDGNLSEMLSAAERGTDRLGKFACSECCSLLTQEIAPVHTKGGNGPCDFCGNPGCTGPLTGEQRQAIIDGSHGKRVVAGGCAVLREHHLVVPNRVHKIVHVLDVLRNG